MKNGRKFSFNISLLPFCVILLNLIIAVLGISGAAVYVLHFKDASAHAILEIRDSVSGKAYGRWRLGESGEFSLEFVHSVHQSPVRETFAAEGGLIRLKELRFYSFGAGMPSHLEEGQSLSRDGDALLITGFTTSFREVNLIVGTVSDHLLSINGETLSLRELAGTNARITIRLR